MSQPPKWYAKSMLSALQGVAHLRLQDSWKRENSCSLCLLRKCRQITRKKVPANPYCWDQKTVVGILENRQYTGCAVNFKTTVSYKVHKTVYKPAEEHQIIPDMQEPIISEEQWLRVQELRKHRPDRQLRAEQACFRDWCTAPTAAQSCISVLLRA